MARTVELRKIDEENYSECLKLKIRDEQKGFVASNVFSLAQAWVFYETAYPFAVYAGDVMVGFVMMGYYKPKDVYNIWRFMIDAEHQGKGYGKEALLLSIKYLRENHGVNEIYLSFEPGNVGAERLYAGAGFKKTGEIYEEQIVMKLEAK